MIFAIIDIETANELFPETVEYMRKSNDGTQVVVHKETLDAARPAQPMTLNLEYDENGEVQEQPYPFPLYSGEEVNALLEFNGEAQDEVPVEQVPEETPVTEETTVVDETLDEAEPAPTGETVVAEDTPVEEVPVEEAPVEEEVSVSDDTTVNEESFWNGVE